MASVKIASLFIRTLAKPISNKLKQQAQEHPRFRSMCVELAQFMHRSEMKMRVNLLGEPERHIRPLNEAKAIQSGANFISESFLFLVAVSIVLAETYRGRRNTAKRRDAVDEKLDDLASQVSSLSSRLENTSSQLQSRVSTNSTENEQISELLSRIIDIGMKSGWTALGHDSKELVDARAELERLVRQVREQEKEREEQEKEREEQEKEREEQAKRVGGTEYFGEGSEEGVRTTDDGRREGGKGTLTERILERDPAFPSVAAFNMKENQYFGEGADSGVVELKADPGTEEGQHGQRSEGGESS